MSGRSHAKFLVFITVLDQTHELARCSLSFKGTNPAVSSEQKPEMTELNGDTDQMMFIFGPKMFSQLRQIKDMEDEQRRQADFPVQRNRHRHPRFNNPKPHQADGNDEPNGDETEAVPPPNMSRYEPFVGERSSLTQEQINYKQTQRKTRLFWEQTSRDIYLTIGFYNVDSTQTRVEFEVSSIYCQTRIRTYDRYVRIHLVNDIVPERCSFQVRRSNILVTLRKAKEGVTWSTLSERAIEPRPEFFSMAYGSDDESETEKRRRNVNRQWQQMREDRSQLKVTRKEENFLIDEIDDDEHQGPSVEKLPKTDADVEANNQQELTDTSSDCHSTDSDDCYYEDQVPANHIPRGYDEADYDHRFYGPQMRTWNFQSFVFFVCLFVSDRKANRYASNGAFYTFLYFCGRFWWSPTMLLCLAMATVCEGEGVDASHCLLCSSVT